MAPTRSALRLAASCALGVAAIATTDAAEWSAAPVFNWIVDQDSNRTLAERSRTSQGGTMRLDLNLIRADETGQFSLRPYFALRRFTQDGAQGGAQDADDFGLDLSSVWLGERSQLTAGASYAVESTLTSELTDTGISSGDLHRRTRIGQLGWEWRHAEDRAFQLQASYANVDYQGLRAERRLGYEYPSLSLEEHFTLSPLTSVSITVLAAELISPLEFADARNQSLSVGLERALSEQTLLHTSLGISRREFQFGQDHGFVWEADVTRAFEAGKLNVFYRRQLVPSGLGFLVERDEAGVTFNHPLSELSSAALAARSFRNDSAQFTSSDERRRFEEISAGLYWHLNETASIGFSVAERRAQQVQGADLTNGFRVVATLTWAPRKYSISR